MSDSSRTKAQQAAIDTAGRGLLVSAGAGSGKTTVLTDRLMRYIVEDKKDISSFVVITFTQAAAAELRGRVMRKLSEQPGDSPFIRRQTALAGKAQIGTIHHFCSSILREYGYLTGIPADFGIISDERADPMKAAALDKTITEWYEDMNAHPGFEELVNSTGIGRDDTLLTNIALTLHSKMQCHPDPIAWADEMKRALRADNARIDDTMWGALILEEAKQKTDYWLSVMAELRDEIAMDEKIHKAYGPSAEEITGALTELSSAATRGWDEFRRYCSFPRTRLGVLKNSPDPELSECFKAQKDSCKKQIEGLQQIFAADSDTMLAWQRAAAGPMSALLDLVIAFDGVYSKAKSDAGVLDYSDLEHETWKLLERQSVCKAVSGRYTEIMVDEYQDVNRVQDEIFTKVSDNGKKLFVVGDIKQAVYRFRLADPSLFNGKIKAFAPLEQAGDGQNAKIFLRENFRSRREIIDAANAVFSRCMSETVGDTEYDESQRLVFGATSFAGTAPAPELVLLDKAEATSVPERVALKIKDLIDNAGYKPDEIAILLRAAGKRGPAYKMALNALGIKTASISGEDLFLYPEITAIVSILKLIDNPNRDIELLAVLKSPMFNFTPDELATIRRTDKKGRLYGAALRESGAAPRLKEFLTTLNEFRDMAPDVPADELIRYITEKTGMRSACGAMQSGSQRLANIERLIQIAADFENEGQHSIHRLVLRLDALAEKRKTNPPAVKGDPGVAIMSIHKSKGLQFRAVFICDTEKQFNRQDEYDTVLIHPELGLGPKYTDRKQRAQYPTAARRAIAMKLDAEMRSEEMRLLYVAMTRAEERLFIVASVGKPTEKIAKAEQLYKGTASIAPEAIKGMSCYADWIIAAAEADRERHIIVSTEFSREAETGEECETQSANPETSGDALADAGSLLDEALKFEYKYAYAQQLPSKITATERSRGMQTTDEDSGQWMDDEKPKSETAHRKSTFRRPDFFKTNKPATGTEKGIATHIALQYMNMNCGLTADDVRGEIERLRAEEFLTRRQSESVDAEAVAAFLRSEIGMRIRTAGRVYREFKFSMLIDAGELQENNNISLEPGNSNHEAAEHDSILLQGVVDCCIEESGELVVIDYKTDNVHTPKQAQERAELYAGQIETYARAMESIYGLHVKETVLYFLSCGEAVCRQQTTI